MLLLLITSPKYKHEMLDPAIDASFTAKELHVLSVLWPAIMLWSSLITAVMPCVDCSLYWTWCTIWIRGSMRPYSWPSNRWGTPHALHHHDANNIEQKQFVWIRCTSPCVTHSPKYVLIIMFRYMTLENPDLVWFTLPMWRAVCRMLLCVLYGIIFAEFFFLLWDIVSRKYIFGRWHISE